MRDGKQQLEDRKNYEFCLSRGEYLSAYFFAVRTGFPFIDATELIRFKRYEGYDVEKICRSSLKGRERAVISGFYGSDETGAAAVFSRGGSDITGSIVAQAAIADLYENWTDVDGILETDPRIVPEARLIEKMTYGELRELSYLGAAIMYPNHIRVLDKLALVSVVGRNMYQRVGVAAKMLTALADAQINIHMLLQDCREINVIAGDR